MDKTGTLTKGEPAVTDVVAVADTEVDRALALAAAVERESEHPLAAAVVRHADALGVERLTVDGFRSIPGRGASGRVQGHLVAVGSPTLLQELGIDVSEHAARRREELAGEGRTAVLLGVGTETVAVIALADEARETAVEAVAALHGLGARVVMLTGDNEATARRIASDLGIDDVIAGVLPDGKAAQIQQLQAQGARVAMVGDGVNDAPALARADLGIAIGAGTDVAIETADVVLMRSDPLDVALALRLGRGTVRKMRQNLGWAIGYNSIALPIAAGVFEPSLGLMLRPEIAALSMSGSSVIVAMNAMLLKRLRLR
jgi:Cu2+-exporting ATPase